jgi:predicted MPP superfamily phosphohydrolase
MLVDDIRRLLTWFVTSLAYGNSSVGGSGTTIDRSTFMRQTALVLGGVSLVGFTAGIANRYKYRVRKMKLSFKSLPDSFKGLRIVQISDIHTGSFDNHAAVAHGIERIMHQKADIILFTGDLVNNMASEVDEKYKEIFSRLKAPMGVYSTLGNHDYGDYVQWPTKEAKKENLEQLKATHADMGWRLLMNEHVVLERGNDKIALVDMGLAYNGLKEKNVPFKILLSHDPSHWRGEVLEKYNDVDLMLSGHTHGMQFGVESKWLKWSPVQYLYNEWAGLYKEGEQHLYVNRGFGFLGYPGRLGVLPEITVIDFV